MRPARMAGRSQLSTSIMSESLRAPELLAPAGTLTHLHCAFAYGANAVYAGQPRYSLRVRNNSFKDVDALAEGIQQAHQYGGKFYLASNISPHNNKVRSYLRDLEPIIQHRPDALIMSDPGLIMLVKERWPEQEIHLSVQANAVNWATVKFWQQQGISRVILSRELGLEEVAEIRQQVPDMELEVFVHGALCMAYSGRCLLSGYMNHRDANQGACTNACRWQYDTARHGHDGNGDLIPMNNEQHRELLLKSPNEPGQFIPAEEDEHGTYIMNSKDLRAVQHVEALTRMGVHSLKIEGRTKSPYYVSRTTQIYRRAIDDVMAGNPFDMQLMDELEALSNRGYTEGFFRRHPPREYQNYEQGTSLLGSEQVCGEILDACDQWLTINVKNRFENGDVMSLITPKGNHHFVLRGMESRTAVAIDTAPGSGHVVRIPRPEHFVAGPHVFLTRHTAPR